MSRPQHDNNNIRNNPRGKLLNYKMADKLILAWSNISQNEYFKYNNVIYFNKYSV